MRSRRRTFQSAITATLGTVVLVIATCLLVGRSSEHYTSEQRFLTTGAISSPPPSRSPAQIVVRHGDTLYGIARRHNVSVYDLMTFNRLDSERIAIGQALAVPPY
jgi:LysM repeat protein